MGWPVSFCARQNVDDDFSFNFVRRQCALCVFGAVGVGLLDAERMRVYICVCVHCFSMIVQIVKVASHLNEKGIQNIQILNVIHKK